MIRATELSGRAVVDIDAAEKIGAIDKIILDPDGRRVAGFVVTRAGSGFPGNKAQTLIPSSAVHAIGPDAVTIRQRAAGGTDTAALEALPRGSDVIGRKVVSEDGRFLGKIGDVLIDRVDGRIFGYLLSEHTPGAKFEELFGKDKKKRRESPCLPADANLRTGRDLIVASEDAVSYDWAEDEAAADTSTGAPTGLWGYKPTANAAEPPVPRDIEPAVVPDQVHAHARTLTTDVEGIETGRETNPRVR
jgi:sporulation protein YlmC with PRC-barrel domain